MARRTDALNGLDRDIRDHIERETQENIERGMTPEEARRQAMLAFGNVSLVREDTRAVWVSRWLDDLSGDVRYAARNLRRAPVFTTTAILILAIGIGGTTAVFSLINALVLRELPIRAADRLATISTESAINTGLLAGRGWNYSMWDRFRDRAGAFDGAFVWMPQRLTVGQGAAVRSVEAVVTTSHFFRTLGIRAVMGRTFTISDDRRGGGEAGPVAVISDAFWRRDLGGSRTVIGTSLIIEGVPFTIIGVTPPGFFGIEVGHPFDVALTFGAEPMIRTAAAVDHPNAFGLIPMVLLKPGQTWAAATAAIRALQPEILGLPSRPGDAFVVVPAPAGTSAAEPGMSGLRQRYAGPLFILLTIVGALLIIVCANLANLLLVRANTRRRELSVRLALGASRWRLVGQLFVESLVLGIAGAISALVLAVWTTQAVVRQMSTSEARVWLDMSFDWRVLTFAALVTIVTVVLFGAAPAWRAAREAPLDAMKGHDRSGRRRAWGGASQGLIVAQVALSLVLVVIAGLSVSTLSHLAAAPLGFDRDEVLLVAVETERTSTAETRLSLYGQLAAAVSAIPGVEHAAVSMSVPLTRGSARLGVDSARGSGARTLTLFNVVSPRWFATYGIPLIRGRDIDARDASNAPRVAIVNETLARILFPEVDPIGQLVHSDAPNWRPRTIVGVVADAVSNSLGPGRHAGDTVRDPVPATMYIPLAQAEGQTPPGTTRLTIGVRPIGAPPSSLAAGVGQAIASTAPNVSYSFRLLADVVSAAFARERLLALVSGFFGALALVLTAIGLYGVISYAASQRKMEIAVRIALGAAPRDIGRLITRRLGLLVGLGIVEGIVLSFWASRLTSSLLYGVTPYDPATLLAATVVVAAAGLAAGSWPAWRASRLDPNAVLKAE